MATICGGAKTGRICRWLICFLWLIMLQVEGTEEGIREGVNGEEIIKERVF